VCHFHQTAQYTLTENLSTWIIYLRCSHKCGKCKPQWIMIECRCTTPNREKSIKLWDKAQHNA